MHKLYTSITGSVVPKAPTNVDVKTFVGAFFINTGSLSNDVGEEFQSTIIWLFLYLEGLFRKSVKLIDRCFLNVAKLVFI